MQYKTSFKHPNFYPHKMAASAPIAIGTRGTVGSLLKKEIEYFTKFELEGRGGSWKPHAHMVDMDCRTGHSRPGFWFLITGWKRKKRKGNTGFLPSMCSAIEVAEKEQFNRIPGFNYRILQNDVHNFHV
ncbi:hypothetical protein V6Z11_A06G174900 [Gossypium hirsutum]|uniref:Uncharacterized protein n=6 Tax=Gossypium TaxID=3633 RepID=A0ABR0PP74_GOSAR|nr:uncharacterized protein LOC107961984 [Gossypium hirsutum]XP_017643956.1 uncharacterized protein LOC108484617 [Gossypium arboreum]KAK5826235.1 hypothetical protein PVK06_021151 [Gossypium arboreum]TYH13977.1 hypothetical protein ES288_A06G181900v1 [Gossypium darwinii]TYI23594.1 hypothetical protein ES332_A06G175100v1 [Gossypium tomentosum]